MLVDSRKERGRVLILRKACQEQAEGNKPQCIWENRKHPSIGSNIPTSKMQQILYSLVLRKPDSGWRSLTLRNGSVYSFTLRRFKTFHIFSTYFEWFMYVTNLSENPFSCPHYLQRSQSFGKLARGFLSSSSGSAVEYPWWNTRGKASFFATNIPNNFTSSLKVTPQESYVWRNDKLHSRPWQWDIHIRTSETRCWMWETCGLGLYSLCAARSSTLCAKTFFAQLLCFERSWLS